MKDFQYQALPMRVTLRSRLAQVTARRSPQPRPASVYWSCPPPSRRTWPGKVSEQLGELSAGVHAEAEMHVPIESAHRAREVAKAAGADGYVAVGGGSTTGLGKAIALEFGASPSSRYPPPTPAPK